MQFMSWFLVLLWIGPLPSLQQDAKMPSPALEPTLLHLPAAVLTAVIRCDLDGSPRRNLVGLANQQCQEPQGIRG